MEGFDYFYIYDYYGFVYITTNLLNGKKYIGKRSFKDGWIEYLGSGTLLREDIKKFGEKNFKKELIEICKTEEILNERESYWIKHFDAKKSDDFYNLTDRKSGRRSYIRRIENGEIYSDIDEASKHTGVSTADIRKSCQYVFYTVLDDHGKVAHFEIYRGDDADTKSISTSDGLIK